MNLNSSRPASRPVVRYALNAVILLGVLVALSPLLQSAYGWWSQRQLLAQWDATQSARPASTGQPRAKPRTAHSAPNASKGAANVGRGASGSAAAITMSAQERKADVQSVPLPPTRISIREIGVDAIVVQGLDEKALARGPGHDPNSALPGEAGNCVLAAHRNVYGSWFYNLDQLWSGSVVELKSQGQTFRYTIVGVRNVSEADGSVLRSIPGAPPSLTLITCTLPHSPFRLVATGYLQGNEPGATTSGCQRSPSSCCKYLGRCFQTWRRRSFVCNVNLTAALFCGWKVPG